MIVVVEGPSAAGKTTWVRRYGAASALIEELPETVPRDDPAEAARFWVDHGARRWVRALELERTTGLAVCDTDPLKLHYAWSMVQGGAGSREDFEAQTAAYREAIVRQRLGFADLYLVSVPDAADLADRRLNDPTRRRRNFDVHVRLGEGLRAWYAALDQGRPGSVRWAFSADALKSVPIEVERYSVGDFDALVDRLFERT